MNEAERNQLLESEGHCMVQKFTIMKHIESFFHLFHKSHDGMKLTDNNRIMKNASRKPS